MPALPDTHGALNTVLLGNLPVGDQILIRPPAGQRWLLKHLAFRRAAAPGGVGPYTILLWRPSANNAVITKSRLTTPPGFTFYYSFTTGMPHNLFVLAYPAAQTHDMVQMPYGLFLNHDCYIQTATDTLRFADQYQLVNIVYESWLAD